MPCRLPFTEIARDCVWPLSGREYLPGVSASQSHPDVLGWREWLSIPDLGIRRIKAKIDTGARSSCLHTRGLEVYRDSSGEDRVRFSVHPLPLKPAVVNECDFPLLDRRIVRDSGGHEEERPFIRVPVVLGRHTWEVEFSLTNRDNMKFRMLLGRTALKGRFLVNPSLSYQFGKPHRSRPQAG